MHVVICIKPSLQTRGAGGRNKTFSFFSRKHFNLYLELPSLSSISHPSSISISARTFAVSVHSPLTCSGSLWLLHYIGAQTSYLKSALSSTHKNASGSPFSLVSTPPGEQDCPPQSSYHRTAALADMGTYTSGRTQSALSKGLLISSFW